MKKTKSTIKNILKKDVLKNIFFKSIYVLLFFISTVQAKKIEVLNTQNEGINSFREALFEANNAKEPSTIIFKIPKEDAQFQLSGGKYLIFIKTPLPEIKSEFPITIEGKNIILDGEKSFSRFTGLTIKSSRHNIKDLTIQNFGNHGILVKGDSLKTVEKIKLQNLHIFDNGTFNKDGNMGDGIHFSINVRKSIISNNIIARNKGNGIFLESQTLDVTQNNLYGNRISGNKKNGIRIEGSANILGKNQENKPLPNIITENNLHGILLSGSFAQNNQITNDFIGSTKDENILGNRLDGIHLKLGAQNNQIGPNLKISNNGGGVILLGEKTNGNKIFENQISFNKSEGILLEKIIDESIKTIISKNKIQNNMGDGIRLYGASPVIQKNFIIRNENYGLFLEVNDNETPDILNQEDEIYSIPQIKDNTLEKNGLGGIYALDTIFENWETIETENKFSQTETFDVLVQWYQLFEITPDSDDFAYLQAEISHCEKNGDSCFGSEIREENHKYYLGSEKSFNPKNRKSFFKVSHFIVKNNVRKNFSPHKIIITGNVEKKLLLNDRVRVNHILENENKNNFDSSNSPKFQASLKTSFFDENKKTELTNFTPNLFNIGKVAQKKEGISFFGTTLSLILTFIFYHFWIAGRKILSERIKVEEEVVKKSLLSQKISPQKKANK